MPETTFTGPDLTTFLGLDALGLIVVGQLLTSTRAIVECRMPIGFEDPFCRACGAQGQARGTVARCLAHAPVGWRSTQLVVRLRRFACTHCRRVWRQDTSALAQPRARLTRSAVEWGLRALALECMSVSRVAAALGISWHTANNAILTSAQATLLDDPHRFDGIEVLGVDDSPARFALVRKVPPCVWRHARRGDRYVTVIIDLSPVRDRTGPARLLDVVPGRSKKVLKTWLAARGESWRGRVEVVAMDGFTGFKSATGEELPQARAVMDPFHVVSLAGDKLDQFRRRIQRAITGWRGRAGDRLYRARRTLRTGAGLLTDAQAERLENLFADGRHAAVQASWGVYQRLIQAYRTEEAGLGKYLMQRLIDSLRQAVPEGLEEIQTLARTLTERASDILAYFDRPRTSNGPTPSHQRTPGAPTRHRPGICATWPATPSAASSTPDASKTT